MDIELELHALQLLAEEEPTGLSRPDPTCNTVSCDWTCIWTG